MYYIFLSTYFMLKSENHKELYFLSFRNNFQVHFVLRLYISLSRFKILFFFPIRSLFSVT